MVRRRWLAGDVFRQGFMMRFAGGQPGYRLGPMLRATVLQGRISHRSISRRLQSRGPGGGLPRSSHDPGQVRPCCCYFTQCRQDWQTPAAPPIKSAVWACKIAYFPAVPDLTGSTDTASSSSRRPAPSAVRLAHPAFAGWPARFARFLRCAHRDALMRPSAMPLALAPSRRICVAPMMEWTDRHCRYLHRLLSTHAWLYTEMVTTGALLHGDVERHLAFDETEHPVALQLGGSEAGDLARCAVLAEHYGYDEINLNCGCPSERVQRGAFGACLMREPQLVADCVSAMRDAVSIPVTVKHRIGLDADDNYSFVRDFVGQVAEAGCATFIVHARNAVLKGLSPKENREIPPLRYAVAYQLKRDFPALEIIVNGGIKTLDEAEAQLAHVDGVMLGRAAYQDPGLLREVDRRFYGSARAPIDDAQVEATMAAYARRELERGTPLHSITRHMLGLHRGTPGARHWRRTLSDSKRLSQGDLTVFADAREAAARSSWRTPEAAPPGHAGDLRQPEASLHMPDKCV